LLVYGEFDHIRRCSEITQKDRKERYCRDQKSIWEIPDQAVLKASLPTADDSGGWCNLFRAISGAIFRSRQRRLTAPGKET